MMHAQLSPFCTLHRLFNALNSYTIGILVKIFHEQHCLYSAHTHTATTSTPTCSANFLLVVINKEMWGMNVKQFIAFIVVQLLLNSMVYYVNTYSRLHLNSEGTINQIKRYYVKNWLSRVRELLKNFLSLSSIPADKKEIGDN